MIDFDQMWQRNTRLLEKMIAMYSIEYTVEQLVYFCQNVYFMHEVGVGRMRLMATYNEAAYNYYKETNEKIKADKARYQKLFDAKAKQVQLYVVGKKQYAKLIKNEGEANFFISQMDLFKSLVHELKHLDEIRLFESRFDPALAGSTASLIECVSFVENAKIYNPLTGQIVE